MGTLGSLFFGSKLLLLCFPLAIVGFLDDRFDLPIALRYSSQLLLSIALLYSTSFYQKFSFIYLYDHLYLLIFIFLAIFITAMINFTNFFDGLDGLLSSCMVIALSTEAYLIAPYLWAEVGALIGFLQWNWSPAKVFMGDAGSTFLGAVFIGVALTSNDIVQFLGIISVSTPIILDTAFCVIRRFIHGQNIFRPHKLHLFQRLYQAGWSHSKVSTIYAMSTVFIALSLLVLGPLYAFIASSIVILYGIYLEFNIATNFIH